MTLTTGRLGKICTKCNKRFVPATKFTRLCTPCFKKAINWRNQNQRTVTKEVKGDGRSTAYMSAWYDFDNEECHL